MKKTLLTIIAFSLAFLFSCKQPEEQQPTTVLEGRWTMISYSSGLSFQRDEYNTNDIIWSFKNLKLTIVHNIEEDPTKNPLISTGDYDIKITKHQLDPTLDVFNIDDEEFIFSNKDNMLDVAQNFGSESTLRVFKLLE